jgi:hypothetical protein
MVIGLMTLKDEYIKHTLRYLAEVIRNVPQLLRQRFEYGECRENDSSFTMVLGGILVNARYDGQIVVITIQLLFEESGICDICDEH